MHWTFRDEAKFDDGASIDTLSSLYDGLSNYFLAVREGLNYESDRPVAPPGVFVENKDLVADTNRPNVFVPLFPFDERGHVLLHPSSQVLVHQILRLLPATTGEAVEILFQVSRNVRRVIAENEVVGCQRFGFVGI